MSNACVFSSPSVRASLDQELLHGDKLLPEARDQREFVVWSLISDVTITVA